jgi:ABC-type multidrug transport system ATPase subunit
MLHWRAVRKCFGQRVVLDGLDAHLRPGCTYGLWGRNGVGKTTLLRIVSGMLLPDGGVVRVLGKDPAADWLVRRQVGIVEDGDTYFPELTAAEYLWWVGRLRKADDAATDRSIDRLAAAFYIEDRLGDLTGSLSHGMRRKVAIASAFVGRPQIVVMDEPTNGLDVDSLRALCSLLAEHRGRGGMALLACHDGPFVRSACSHVVRIEDGRLSEPVPVAEAADILGDQILSTARF